MRRILILLAIAALISSARGADECLSLYDYDDSEPPEVEQSIVTQDEDVTIYRLILHSVNGELVPTLLSVPRGGRLRPVVILLHGYGGDKSDLMDAADPVAKRGYAAAAIDAQYHGERKREGLNMYSADVEMTIGAFTQTVMDVRRLIDHLETRGDVDSGRIGLVGGSMGALLGAIVSGVDDRIDVPVLVVGGGNMTLLIGESQLPRVVEIRAQLEEQDRTIQEVAAELRCIDPIEFVPMISPRPLLMINGRTDDVVPISSNQALYEAAGNPKRIVWYDTGHDVPTDPAVTRAYFWLERHLKKRPYLQAWFYILVGGLVAVLLAAYLLRRNRPVSSFSGL